MIDLLGAFGLNVAAGLSVDQLLRRDLRSRLDLVIRSWAERLTPELTLQPEALFSPDGITEHSDTQKRRKLLDLLQNRHLPKEEDWFLALCERWMEIRSIRKKGETQHFFRAEKRLVIPALKNLASELFQECARNSDYSRPALVEGMQELQRQFHQLPASMVSLSEARDNLGNELTTPNEALRFWLDRMIRDHRQLMPYFERRSTHLLEHIYVELHLNLSPQQHPGIVRSDTSLERLLDRPLSMLEVLELDPKSQPWVTRRWLLKGDPGSGKTTLLRQLARRLAEGGESIWVPVFESLPKLLRQECSLFERIERNLTRANHPGAEVRQFLEDQANKGGLALLLDGLDEVPKELRSDAEDLLRDIGERWPKSAVVVTTRPIGAGRIGPEYNELQVLPLNDKLGRRFLAQWFGQDGEPDTERAESVYGKLKADRNLRELISNPLYLTLIAILVEEGAEPARHRTKLFDQIFDLLEEGRHHKPPTPIRGRETAHAGLRFLAYQLTKDNRDAESAAALEARLLNCDDVLSPLQKLWETPRHYLDDIFEDTGILGPHDGPESDWQFWHRTFREALAAETLEEMLRTDEANTLLLDNARRIAADDLSRWAEPYALLAGRVEDPDSLVKALVSENRQLGLRAVATAQGLKESTLREILDLSEKWEDRSKVYGRIPELIDDPYRALALLNKLRQSTRNGNDLFFLEQAVAAVAEKWPRMRHAVDDVQGRFYDHIPTPPIELFRQIFTPFDGRVEFWTRIPAGHFWMGDEDFWEKESFIEDELDFGSEDPQHKASIQSSFSMSVTPVTVAQFTAFEPSLVSGAGFDFPEAERMSLAVDSVTWFQAVAFCRWLSASVSWCRDVRLPTEEEWEYACRAGTSTRYWSGNHETDLNRVGWYEENADARPHRVGEKSANPAGLYDVHGNVGEWTLSEWTQNYSDRQYRNEIAPRAINMTDFVDNIFAPRVVRGGSCWHEAWDARCATRRRADPREATWGQGFRLCLAPAPERA